MSDEDGIGQFYAEVHTPASVRSTYAPKGECLGCGAKLSIYRTQSYGEYDRWCAPCQISGEFLLQCSSCWEMFPSFGTREICSKCLVPAQRKIREEEAYNRAAQACDMLYRYNFSIEKTVESLKYSSPLELKRALLRAQEIENND